MRCGTRTVTPPARAMSHSPASRLWQARWTATSEVEQAVWTEMLGPRRLSLWEIRVLTKSLSLPQTCMLPVGPISRRWKWKGETR